MLTYRYSPEEMWGWPGGTYRGWTGAFVRVTDEDGQYGIGEIGDGLPAHELVPAAVEKLGATIIGEDPKQIRKLKDRMYRSVPGWGRRGLGISVISGIETALFDLVGKVLKVPAHVLVGGAIRDRLPVYASGGVDRSPQELAEEFKGYVERGFKAVKVRIGYGLERDVKIVSTVRAAIGKETKLLLDYGGSYLPHPQNALELERLARMLEPYDPFWLEEPLHPDDLVGHARLRSATSIPIAAGENTRTIHEAAQMVEIGAVDILQTDVVYAGGILEQLEIAAMAARKGVMMAPHTWGSAPGLMANIHAAACIPNLLLVEYSQAYNPLRERILTQPLRMENGELIVPDTPGLGVDITEELMEAYPYDPSGAPVLKLEDTARK